MNNLLWVALPYVALLSLIVGLVWRYRYDRFGWTTRSSQLYEHRVLRWASPAFHYGILFVLAGHLVGLFIPASWTDRAHVSEHVYHLFSLFGGTAAGVLTVAGIGALIWRRRTKGAVFLATTRNDKLMYVFLLASICLGMWAKLAHSTISHGYDYRHTVALWARSIFSFNPQPHRMQGVPTAYQVHVVVGMLLIGLVPYTRLVHMFSAPVQYLVRPYILYRSREPQVLAERRPRRGWEGVGS